MTTFIITVTLSYFSVKLQDLMAGKDQTINYNVLPSYYAGEEGLDFIEAN